LTSTTLWEGVPGFIHYVSSKGGIIAFTRALARELGPEGIRVNAMAPGFTLTEANMEQAAGAREDWDEVFRGQCLTQRHEVADDLTGPAFFLASPDSDFMAGQTILVDGGLRHNQADEGFRHKPSNQWSGAYPEEEHRREEIMPRMIVQSRPRAATLVFVVVVLVLVMVLLSTEASLASSGSPASLVAGTAGTQVGDSTQQLVSGGLTRTFLVHVPASYTGSAAVPLVLVYHGLGGTGQGMSLLTHFSRVADKSGFIVVYPDGINKAWITNPSVDDVGFTRELIKYLEAKYKIDVRRVYATGMSNGGFMCYSLAYGLSDLIAAFAPVSALLPSASIYLKFPRPVPVHIIQGTADPLVPYNGGALSPVASSSKATVMSAPSTASYFVKLDGCSTSATTESLPDKVPTDGSTAKRATYSGGRNGTEVVLITVVGGGHTWPGGLQYLPVSVIGPGCQDFDASELIWQFFARHTLGG
jgi:polyhydroxybutyrate depolymerase